MKNLTKIGATVAAVGALGVAGSFGTFSAFTAAAPSHAVPVHSGTIKVDNEFALPDLTNLGTRDTEYNCNRDTGLPGTTEKPNTGSECWAGSNGKSAGHITVTNTGSLAQDVYIDFDGPGVADVSSPNVENSNPLASNIIVDSSMDPDFTTLGWEATRLFRMNAAGPVKYFTLAAGEAKTVYFRAWLRERLAGAYPGGDNEMQDRSIDNEKVTVSAIEVGRTDLATGPDAGN
ncbi:MAG TPA: hypothetical protein VGJ32_10870 [Solirubrobacteraceae bacterium]|jgi:hypothetical protein